MKIKDYRDAQNYYAKDDRGDSTGAFKNFVRDSRSMDSEPRNMYAEGQLVQNTVDGSRPGYNGNLDRRLASAQELYDLYGKDTVDNAAKEWAKKSNLEKNRTRQMEITNFDEMPNANDRNTFKVKFKKDMKEYKEWNPDRKSSAAQKRYADHVKRAKTGTFEEIIFDAFGRDKLKGTKTPNPTQDLPKLDAIHKNIDEYNI